MMKKNPNDDKFIEASKRERFVLSKILPEMKGTHTEWTQHLTDVYGHDRYDALLCKYRDGTIIKRYIIEVKIRNTTYGEMILETKKLNDLKRYVLDDITDIIYINVLPTETRVWNITLMEKKGLKKGEPLFCPKSTMGDTTKVNKGNFLLPLDEGKKIEYTFNENEYRESLNIVKENDKYTARKAMYNYLFNIK